MSVWRDGREDSIYKDNADGLLRGGCMRVESAVLFVYSVLFCWWFSGVNGEAALGARRSDIALYDVVLCW